MQAWASLSQLVAMGEDVPEDVAESDYYSMLTYLKAVRHLILPSPDRALRREFQAYLLLRYQTQVVLVVVLKIKIYKISWRNFALYVDEFESLYLTADSLNFWNCAMKAPIV